MCLKCDYVPCQCPNPKETTVEDESKQPARRGLDRELQAVAKIDRILGDFEPETAYRILNYLMGKNSARMERPEPGDEF